MAIRERGANPSSTFRQLEALMHTPNKTVIIQGQELPAAVAFMLPDATLSRIGILFQNPMAKEVLTSTGAVEAVKKDLARKKEDLKSGGMSEKGICLSDYVVGEEAKEIMKAIPLLSGVVVEMDCSTGKLLASLSERPEPKPNFVQRLMQSGKKKNLFVALDINEHALKIGKKMREEEQNNRIRFLISDATSTCLPNRGVDTVISKQLISSMCDSKDDFSIMKHFFEVNRVLKRSGIYYVVEDTAHAEFVKDLVLPFGFDLIEEIHIKGVLTPNDYMLLVFKKVVEPTEIKEQNGNTIVADNRGNMLICDKNGQWEIISAS